MIIEKNSLLGGIIKMMQEIIHRLMSETPQFWKTIQKICFSMGACGGIVMVTPAYYPAFIASSGSYLLTIGLFGTFLSQLSKKDV